MDKDISTVLGFCTGFGVLASLLAGLVNSLFKKHLEALKQNEGLKSQGVKNQIKESSLELKLLIQKQEGEFKALHARVESALKQVKELSEEQTKRYETSITAIKIIIQKSEQRFLLFQKELKDTRFMVERIKKKEA